MDLSINYKNLGTFTPLPKGDVAPPYPYHFDNPQNVEEDKEKGNYAGIKSLAKGFLKIIATPALYFERVSKIAMTYLICPYQFLSSEKDFYKDKTDKIKHFTDGQIQFNNYTLEPEGANGPQLDAIEFIPRSQQGLKPEEQKWIFFSLPNGATHQSYNAYLFLATLSRITGICFACTNYRGARKEPFHRPEIFKDLVNDVDTLVKHKFSQGVLPENSMMQGFSLGGSVALHVAARHQKKGHEMSYFGENTFNRLHKASAGYASGEAMVRFVERHLSDYIIPPKEGIDNFKGRALHAIREIAGFLPHIILRTVFYAALFFEHMYFAEITKAWSAICEMIKTMMIDPLILISSIAALIASPFADLTYAIRYLGSHLAEDFGDSLIFVIARSRMFTSISEKFIIAQGWKTEGVDEWKKLKGEKFATAVKTDTVIHWDASLVNGIMNEFGPESDDTARTYVHKNQKATHVSFVIEDNPGVYFSFLERAFKIKYPEQIFDLKPKQMTHMMYELIQ